jgi:hypothetical protein
MKKSGRIEKNRSKDAEPFRRSGNAEEGKNGFPGRRRAGGHLS